MEAVMQAGAQSGKLVVKANEIHKAFGERKIVDNFSTQIKRGARIGLIGANGAGKNTLPVSYTHLTRTTNREVKIQVGAVIVNNEAVPLD